MAAVSAAELRRWLHDDDRELALFDVREPGQIADGHILFSVPLPYSRFEIDLPRLAPNPDVRMVLCDDGDGVAERAARRAAPLGYTEVHWLDGGVASWAAAGHGLFQGVNVPSKAFGELVERACGTPRIGPAELARMQDEGRNLVVVDGRTPAEFARMSIPGATFCPNGELALRIDRLAPDPATTIVVNCAGRTRSIVGAQTLIDLGLPNRVLALENGTQGWVLAGLELERDARPVMPDPRRDLTERRRRAKGMAARHGVAAIAPEGLSAWLCEAGRTVYLLDIRSAEERAADPDETRELLDGHAVVHAPGGQLVQATDHWIGVRRASIIVLDTEEVRAPVTASWLARQGHAAAVLEGGIAALGRVTPCRPPAGPVAAEPPRIAPGELAALVRGRRATVLDLRSSADYRSGHIPGAAWSVRPRIAAALGRDPHVLVSDDPAAAALAVIDLAEAGAADVRLLDAGPAAWRAAGLEVETTPGTPPDSERIDFVAFTHGRHDGNLEASRQYLAWELGLVERLDPQERAAFRI